MRLLSFGLLVFVAACGSSPKAPEEDQPKPLPKHIKEQEKGLAEDRDTEEFTETKPIPTPTKAERAEFKRIWSHYGKADPRWPLERDRFKSRSEGAGYLLATYLLSYYMQLNVVRDRAGKQIVAVKNEIVAAGSPCAPLLVDMMILDALPSQVGGKRRKLRIDDLTRQDCSDMLERIGRQSTPHLLRALKRKDLGIKGRRMLALTLGGTRDRRGFDALVSLLRTDQSWQVRADAATGLGKLGDRRAIAPLTDAVRKDRDAFVVKRAGKARSILQGGGRRG